MVTEGFRVLLGGKTVAHLYARGDYTWLEWQQGYWDDPDRPMLGLRFEDTQRNEWRRLCGCRPGSPICFPRAD